MTENIFVNTEELSSPENQAHGRAALILVESLLHGLIDRNILSLSEALEIVDTATEVRSEIGVEMDHAHMISRTSLYLLQAIGASLRADIPNQP